MGKVGLDKLDLLFKELQTLPGIFQSLSIPINSDEQSILQSSGNLIGMAPAADGGIEINSISSDVEKIQDLLEQDRLVNQFLAKD